MIEFFDGDSQIVKQYVFLVSEGLLAQGDIPPLYNLREVVDDELSKDDRMVDEANNNNVEGGD